MRVRGLHYVKRAIVPGDPVARNSPSPARYYIAREPRSLTAAELSLLRAEAQIARNEFLMIVVFSCSFSLSFFLSFDFVLFFRAGETAEFIAPHSTRDERGGRVVAIPRSSLIMNGLFIVADAYLACPTLSTISLYVRPVRVLSHPPRRDAFLSGRKRTLCGLSSVVRDCSLPRWA